MENVKKTKKRKKDSGLVILVAVLAVILVIVLGLLMWLQNDSADQPEGTLPSGTETAPPTQGTDTAPQTQPGTESVTQPTTEPPVESTKEPVTEPVIVEPVGIAVTTPYMTFFYPEEWQGKVVVQQSDDGANHTVTFQTDISGKEVVLFSIELGPEDADGYLLGQLNDETAGAIKVHFIVNDMSPDGWTDEEYIEICAMQERVNDMIAQLHEDARFEPAG